MDETIAKRLADAIGKSQLSYREIAERSGVPKSAIQRYANGETEKIPVDRLKAIANAIDEDSAYLMGWNVASKQHMDGIAKALDVVPIPDPEYTACDLSEDAYHFAQEFDQLDSWARELLWSTLKHLLQKHRK